MCLPNLVNLLSLLDLRLQQFLDGILDNLSSLLHPTCKCGKRLFQLALHLRGNILMLLRHLFHLTSDRIEGRLQTACLLGTEGFAGQME